MVGGAMIVPTIGLMALPAPVSATGTVTGELLPTTVPSFTFAETLKFHDPNLNEDAFDGMSLPSSRFRLLNGTQFRPSAVISRRGTPARPLPVAKVDATSLKLRLPQRPSPESLISIINDPNLGMDGMIVLKNGTIVVEEYPRMRPWDRHVLNSISKSFVGTLVALLVDRGQVDPSRGVQTYIKSLAGTGWDGVSVRDILDMASGTEAVELNVNADGSIAKDPPVIQKEFRESYYNDKLSYDVIAGFKRHRAPGTKYEYSGVNTVLLGWLCEEMWRLPLHEIISLEIWGRIGADNDATIYISPRGANDGKAGISCTLRDLARYGLQFTDLERLSQRAPIFSELYRQNVVKGRRDVFLAGDGSLPLEKPENPLFASWQWDKVWGDGDMLKGGVFGQALFVSPRRNIVIAFVSSGTIWSSSQLGVYSCIRELSRLFG